jgi:hypothetical protein
MEHIAVSLKRLKKNVTALGLTLAVLGSASALLVTDLRARTEGRRATSALTSAGTHLSQARTRLVGAQAQMRTTAAEVQALDGSIAQSQTSLAASVAAISSAERGLFYGGFDISALNTCLSGVTQALDQIAVGQTAGALSSLGAASTSCNSAKTGAG